MPYEITAVWENDTLLLLIEEPQETLKNAPKKTHTLLAENICCIGQTGHNAILYIFHFIFYIFFTYNIHTNILYKLLDSQLWDAIKRLKKECTSLRSPLLLCGGTQQVITSVFDGLNFPIRQTKAAWLRHFL